MRNAIIYTCLLLSFTITWSFGQKSMIVGTHVTDKPNAILVLNPPDGDQGFLLPQLTTANRLAIQPTSPAEDGLVVFDITEKSFYFWKDSSWNQGLGNNQTLSYDPLTQTISLSDGNTISLASLKELPNQTGQAGKFLMSNGTAASWAVASLGTVTSITAGTGLSGGVITSAGIIALTNTGVAATSYGSGSQIPVLTIDAQGRITNASSVSITGAAPIGTAGGDLEGNYPNPTIKNDAITAGKIQDGAVTSSKIADAAIQTIDLSNDAITSQKISDGTIVAADLAANSVTDSKIVNVTPSKLTAAGASTGQVLKWNGTNWVPQNDIAGSGTVTSITAGAGLDGGIITTSGTISISDGGVTNIKLATNSITSLKITDGTIATTDLDDNSVTTAKLAPTGVTASTYGSTSQVPVLIVDTKGRITSVTNVAITGTTPGGTAGGDLAGNYPNPTVAEIRGNLVNSATLGGADNGKALVWDGAQWIATVVPGITLQTSYYAVDPSDFALVKDDQNDNHGSVIFNAENTFVTGNGNDQGEFIMAPLHLPHGAILNQMIIYYGDNSPTSITVSLLRKNLATSASNVMNTWTSSVNTGGILTQTTALFNGMEVISNEIYSYRVYVNFNFTSNVDNPGDAIQRIYGVRIRYQH